MNLWVDESDLPDWDCDAWDGEEPLGRPVVTVELPPLDEEATS